MEIHIVHFKAEYGSFEKAQNYIDGVCVVALFGEVINIYTVYILYCCNKLKYLIFVLENNYYNNFLYMFCSILK